jgi:anti-sigma factor ChrR (cupin superfamily)
MGRHYSRQQAGHPDEAKLLLQLNGELDSGEEEAIRIHLQRCGQCQARIQTLKKGMNAYGAYREAAFLPAVGMPPKGWREFPALLDRIAASDYRWKRNAG